jgi:hypothetical protein
MARSASCRFIRIAYFETFGECSLGKGDAPQVSRCPRCRIRQPTGIVLETLKTAKSLEGNTRVGPTPISSPVFSLSGQGTQPFPRHEAQSLDHHRCAPPQGSRVSHVAKYKQLPDGPSRNEASTERNGIERREQSGSKGLARQPYEKRKTEICEGRYFPLELRRPVMFEDILENQRRAAGAEGRGEAWRPERYRRLREGSAANLPPQLLRQRSRLSAMNCRATTRLQPSTARSMRTRPLVSWSSTASFFQVSNPPPPGIPANSGSGRITARLAGSLDHLIAQGNKFVRYSESLLIASSG